MMLLDKGKSIIQASIITALESAGDGSANKNREGALEDQDNPDDYFDAAFIDNIQVASIKHLGPYKVIQKSRDQAKLLKLVEPSIETLEKIYKHYCNQLHQVPVRFLHMYKNGWLKLHNFNLQQNMTLALACVIPVRGPD